MRNHKSSCLSTYSISVCIHLLHITFIMPSMKPHDIMHSSIPHRFIAEMYYVLTSQLIRQPADFIHVMDLWVELEFRWVRTENRGDFRSGTGKHCAITFNLSPVTHYADLSQLNCAFSTRRCSEPNNQHPVHGRRQPFLLTHVTRQDYWISNGSL